MRGPHGRGGDRHRRDQLQGPQLHHRGRRPRGTQRDQRDAGQGRGHRQTIRVGLHGAQRRPQPRAPGDVRHEPGIRQGHPPMAAQRRESDRQVPCDQARQRGRRQGQEGRGPGERPVEKDEVPVAQKRGEPDRAPASDQAQPATAAAQDRAGLPDARAPKISTTPAPTGSRPKPGSSACVRG